jgi:3-oxoadipate enol-lactonase
MKTRWLLLHGAPLTPAVWDGVLPLLAAHGTPVAPPVVVSDDRRTQADIAAGLATEPHEAPPPWHVVGHSFGGQVALELALQRPDLVSGLTLLCTRDTPYPPFVTAADNVAAGHADVDGALRRWFTPTELVGDGPVVRYARTTLENAERAPWAAAMKAISTFDCSAATASITCPTLVVAAEHDEVSDPATMAAMHQRLTGSEFVILEDFRHMSVFTDSQRLAALLTG